MHKTILPCEYVSAQWKSEHIGFIAQTIDDVMKQWANNNMPECKPYLIYKGSKWVVHLKDVFPGPGETVHYYGASNLDSRAEWAAKTLETWQSAKRTAWDMWAFTSKKEAEKFIVLYNLTWA